MSLPKKHQKKNQNHTSLENKHIANRIIWNYRSIQQLKTHLLMALLTYSGNLNSLLTASSPLSF